jgi:Tfp pilus assembly protein PilN
MGMLPVPLPSKEVAKEIEDGAKSFFGIVQRVLRVTSEQQKQAALITKLVADLKAQAGEIAGLRDELHTLKAREEVVIVRAESAATRAASTTMADLARRIGHLEARHGNAGKPQLD